MKSIHTLIFTGFAIIILNSCSRSNDFEIPTNDTKELTMQTESSGSNVSFANGQAALVLNGLVQHFSFHVAVDANGIASGTWESKSPGQELRTHGILNCLVFIDDQTAYMTGVITQKTGNGFPGEYEVGMPVWFKVRDNGQGNNNITDEFTDYYSLQGIECINYPQASMHPIIHGNIHVSR